MFYFWRKRYLEKNILVAKKTTAKETSVFIKNGKTNEKTFVYEVILSSFQ